MRSAGWALLLVILMAGAAGAEAPRHDQAIAVPVPGRVQVDGNLGDWDLSGLLETWYDDALKPRFALKFAVMYDREALYLSAHFADDTPLMNQHDPAVEPGLGWAGDCLQVRLCSDAGAPYPLPGSYARAAEQVCHLTMWYYTGKKLPVLQVSYGMDYHGGRLWTGTQSGLAFLADKDGQGYTLEARVPWSRLNAGDKPPRAGDYLALVVQPLWGDATGWKHAQTYNDVTRTVGFSFQGTEMWGRLYLSPKGRLPATERPVSAEEKRLPLELSVPLPDNQAKAISAALYDREGVLVRSLLTGYAVSDYPRKGNSLAVKWDGLDDDGAPLAPGDYRLKVLTHRGTDLKWVTSLHNAGNPPWVTDDGTGSWGGDHAPPVAAASDEERVYLGWGVSEAGWANIAVKTDLTAESKPRKLWGQGIVLEVGIVVTAQAADGKYLYVAQDGKFWGGFEGDINRAGIVRWNALTGRPENFAFGKRVLSVTEWPDGALPPDLPLWERYAQHRFGPDQARLNLLGIAVQGNNLYASLYLDGRVVKYDLQTGEKAGEWAIPHPVGLQVAADGQVLVVSEQSVVRLDPASGQVVPVVTTGLSAPYGLALDKQGNVYVTDRGEAMQVKIFDPSGKMLGTIGKPGGRPWLGKYEPEGMLQPAGITVDAAGKIWVAEQDDSPRRVSVWSREGRLLADLHGPGSYAVMSAADEDNPRRINVHGTLYEIDYDTGASRCLSTLVRPNLLGRQVTPDFGVQGRHLDVRHFQGRTYLIGRGRGNTTVFLYDERTMTAQPVAAVSAGLAVNLGPAEGWSKQDVRDVLSEANRKLVTGPDGKQGDQGLFYSVWADLNGDGLYQAEELTIEAIAQTPLKARPGLYWGDWFTDDMTLYEATPWNLGYVLRAAVKEWLPSGVPVYPPLSEWELVLTTVSRGTVGGVQTDTQGSIYLLEEAGTEGGGTPLRGLSRYAPGGKRLWTYRKVWLNFGLDAPLFQPGMVVGAMKLIGQGAISLPGGKSLNLVAVNGYFGQFNVLSEDGLWVTALSKDKRYGPKADSSLVWPENFSGFFYRNRENGKFYLQAGDTDARVWEVLGLETIRTGEGAVRISAADQKKAMEALAAGAPGTAAGKRLEMARLGRAPVLDGDLAEWDLRQAVPIDAGAGRTAQAVLGYDGENLYLACRVKDDSPMRNAAGDPALLFKSGDAVDLMLAANPQADPQRTRPAAGDLRLLFSVVGDQPVAVVYKPVSPREKQPRNFTSPTGGEQFDYVAPITEAQVKFQTSPQGYTLEAAVPLAALGLIPQAGMVLRGDVGVLFSDAGGSRTAVRAYWANRSAEVSIVNDLPTEARLQPQHWGLIAVE